jgi:hypothetical protein
MNNFYGLSIKMIYIKSKIRLPRDNQIFFFNNPQNIKE